jgi:hypothetical protein
MSKKNPKRLQLSRETIRKLQEGDLKRVVGGRMDSFLPADCRPSAWPGASGCA